MEIWDKVKRIKTFDTLLARCTDMHLDRHSIIADPRVAMFVTLSELYNEYLPYTHGEIFLQIRNWLYNGIDPVFDDEDIYRDGPKYQIITDNLLKEGSLPIVSDFQIMVTFVDKYTNIGSYGNNTVRHLMIKSLVTVISGRSRTPEKKIKEDAFPHIMLAIATCED